MALEPSKRNKWRRNTRDLPLQLIFAIQFAGLTIAYLVVMSGLLLAQEAETAGPDHPRCSASYWRLPLNKFGYPIDTDEDGDQIETNSIIQHLHDNKAAYLAYDRDCFFGYSKLQQHTKTFIAGSLGVVFTDDPHFVCAAFRVAKSMIATAGHCAGDISGSAEKAFYLIGYPDRKIHIGARVNFGPTEIISDFDDVALFKIEDPGIPGSWTSRNFSRKLAPNQNIGIIAVSIISTELINTNRRKWREDVRFSRAYSSKVSAIDVVKPDHRINQSEVECIYHKAPTFPGMSGSPILAMHAAQGKPTYFTVVGIHLRSGMERPEVCGIARGYNIGIKLPEALIRKLYPTSKKVARRQ